MNPCRCVQRDVRRAGEVGTDIGPVDRLLAGDPAAPRHPTARAVHLGAVEAGERPDDLADGVTTSSSCRPGRRSRTACHGPNGGPGLLTSWLRTSHDVPVGTGERGHAVVAARQRGAVVERDRELGVVERPVLEPGGNQSRTAPSRRSGTGAKVDDGCAAPAADASSPSNAPLTTTPPVVATAARRNPVFRAFPSRVPPVMRACEDDRSASRAARRPGSGMRSPETAPMVTASDRRRWRGLSQRSSPTQPRPVLSS